MATASLAGYKAFLQLSTASGGSKTRIAELRDYTLTVEHAEIDATSHDSSGTREVIAGTDNWTGSAELLTVIANAEQKEAFDITVGKTLVDFEFVPTGSSSDGSFSGSGFMRTFEMGAPNEDALNTSVSMVGSGALTRNSSA